MNTVTHPNKKIGWKTRAAVIGTAPLLALGLAGCSTAGEETGADVEDVQELEEEEPLEDDAAAEDDAADVADGPYDGPYDEAFYANIDEVHAGETVTVSALVNEVISPEVFTIAGTDETTVDALPVLHGEPMDTLESGLDVRVTGVVMTGFDLVAIEDEMGIDLDDELFEEWDGQPYIDATGVDSTVSLEE